MLREEYVLMALTWDLRLGIFTSILMFLVPIPAILPLKLPRRQKIIVVGIFALGFL